MLKNPDGSMPVLIYGGCECAGGEVLTAQDLPIRSPHREAERKRQQEEFDKCVRSAVGAFRRAEYSAIAKIAGGTVGTYLGVRGSLAAGRANAAAHGVLPQGWRVARFSTRYRFGQAIEVGGPIAGVFTGQALLDGFKQSGRNHAALDKDIDLCKGLSPQADHSTLGIRLTTWF